MHLNSNLTLQNRTKYVDKTTILMEYSSIAIQNVTFIKNTISCRKLHLTSGYNGCLSEYNFGKLKIEGTRIKSQKIQHKTGAVFCAGL